MKNWYMPAVLATATLILAACGGSSNNNNNDGGTGTPPPAQSPWPPGAILLDAGDDLTQQAQEALINAQTGDWIVFPEGTFEISSTLTFDGDVDGDGNIVEDITITGYGMDKTILNFENANSGDGFYVQNAKDITFTDLSVREAKNNGIKLKDTDGIILRDLSTIWEGSLNKDNGAYGVYPVECSNILIENTYVRGSADAGIYVGQSEYIVVRNNIAEENVAGIEIENSKYADVYQNTAVGNTGGILVFDLPINNQRYGTSVRVFNNVVTANNTPNFANASSNPAGVHIVPQGTGIIVLSTSDVEIFDNEITDNDTMGVAVSSFFIAEQDIPPFLANYGQPGQAIEDGWRAVPRNINVHDNQMARNGTNPKGELIQDIIDAYLFYYGSFPAILYDGLGESIANNPQLGPLFMEEPFAEDGSDAICATINPESSLGQLYRGDSLDPTSPDLIMDPPFAGIMQCTQPQLPVHTATINGQVYGCGIDDDVEMCAGSDVIGDDDNNPGGGGDLPGGGTASCEAVGNEVNWEGLLGADCETLSSYNLFADAANPAGATNGGGLPYDLNTQLFTDYASKYRYVFMPEGTAAQYTADESFEFPVGTVLVKTFALPANTDNRGLANEELIETRLLIRRDFGWTTLPYVWNAEKSDAVLSVAGAVVPGTVTHEGQTMDFPYVVPKRTDCKQCHQFKEEGMDNAVIFPIGPKARNLNKDYPYAEGAMNQLAKWQELGILEGVPADPAAIDKVPPFNGDTSGLAALSDEELMDLAKGYLDVNCAHCHRQEGNASNTGMAVEFPRPYEGNEASHGTCKQPVAYGGGNLGYDVVPGNPDESITHFRMNSNEPGDRMPELGRSLIDAEGVELINQWITRLPLASCSG
jgi:parallel beta-helix repeat protein